MTDRRRVNGPAGGTVPHVFCSSLIAGTTKLGQRPKRVRNSKDIRKIYLKTGLTPSASGSAYFELEQPSETNFKEGSLVSPSSTVKLTCTVHGPRPLPRSAPFAPHILLSTHVKFAPFAARQRRGYLRDASERDLAVHLETALKGVIIGDRWPKSGVEVIVTVLEGEEDQWWVDEATAGGREGNRAGASGMMSILSGCITVASAAIVDAGIDCVDLVSGGVAAVVCQSSVSQIGLDIGSRKVKSQIVMDPAPMEHTDIIASCVVGYLQSRDEVTELWVKGNVPSIETSSAGEIDPLIDSAVQAAVAARLVLVKAIKESAELQLEKNKTVE